MGQFPRVGDQFGRYRVDAQIGFGGMGVVFGATDLTFDRPVALKVVSAALGGSAEFLQRFEREAALLARLDSPHVIGIFDYGEHDGCPYLATQYVGGGDLGALLAARGPMPPPLAARVCAQVADALVDAHAAGVVHRDVKPSNVLLRDADSVEPHAYLCDFGIARTADESGLTQAGSVSGTWTYLAPECGSGATATPASDLYSVGCLFWAALTGRAPYVGTDVEVAVAHQRSPVPQLAGDDPFSLLSNQILRGCLAKDPDARYADADALRTDLLAAAGTPSSGVVVLPPPTPGTHPHPRPPTPTPTPLPSSLPDSLPSSPARPTSGAPTPAADDPRGGGGLPGRAGRGRRRGRGHAAHRRQRTRPRRGSIQLGRTVEPHPHRRHPTETEPDPEPTVGISGDIDGDGLGDLLAERQTEEQNSLVRWSSSGRRFRAPSEQSQRAGRRVIQKFVTADLDGDDADEVLRVRYLNRRAAPVEVLVTQRDGTTAEMTLEPPTTTQLMTFYPGDVDGDGRDDLVISVWDEGEPFRYFVSRSTDEGLARPRRALTTSSTYTDSATEVGDIDGDGRADVVVSTVSEPADYTYRSTVEVFRSDGSRFVSDESPRSFASGLAPDLHTADVDGDGDREVLAIDLYAAEGVVPIRVLDYAKDRLGRAVVKGLVSEGGLDSTVSDVTGDGRDDIVQLYRTEAESSRVTLEVVAATESGFAEPKSWGTWRLGKPDQSYASLVGSSFP